MHKSQIIAVLLITGFVKFGTAQSGPVTGGKTATGAGGSASYSLGQVFYQTQAGSSGSALQGIQQPYEVTELPDVTGVHDKGLLSLRVYPNPSTEKLTVDCNSNLEDLVIELLDGNGKLLQTCAVVSNSTQVVMEQYPPAIYMVRVSSSTTKESKSFKIIKN